MVNLWVREYLKQPGRQSSASEKARRQAFLPKSQEETSFSATQQHSGFPLSQADGQEAPFVEEPLESPHRLVWLLLRDPSSLSQREQRRLAFICQEKDIHVAYGLSQQFVTMVRTRHASLFDSWLTSCLNSGIPDLRTFAQGLQKEYLPIKAALTLPYSNGMVEGFVNKVKWIKRSPYGQAGFALLQRHVLLHPAAGDVLHKEQRRRASHTLASAHVPGAGGSRSTSVTFAETKSA